MFDRYQIDKKLAFYWIIGIIAVSSGFVAFSGDFSQINILGQDNPEESEAPDFSLNIEDQELSPNELSRLRLLREDESIEGAEIYVGEIYIGETNSEGRISFRALDSDFNVTASLNETEVKERIEVIESGDDPQNVDDGREQSEEDEGDEEDGSDEGEQDEDDQDEEDDEGFTGFRLESDPIAEERNRLTVFEEDKRLGGVNVTLNGDLLGQTTPGGSISFEVPNSPQITLEASGIEQTFDVQGYEEDDDLVSGDIDPAFTRSGIEYEGENVTFNASATQSRNSIEAYRWNFSHSDFTDQLEGEIIDYQIPEEGNYNITLEVEDSEGFTSTDEDFMSAEPEYTGPTIYLSSPRDGEIVEAEHEFEFQVENARNGQKAYVVVNGKREASTSLESGLNLMEDEDAVRSSISSAGIQDYWIEVEDQGGTWTSDEQKQINNTRAYGDFGQITIDAPADGSTVSSPANFNFSFDLKTDINMIIDGQETGNLQQPGQFRHEESIHEDRSTYRFEQELNKTEYEWSLFINVPDTSERETFDIRTLEVE